MSKPLIEVLAFEGCPNTEPTIALVQRLVNEMRLDVEVRRVEVPDAETAVAQRFLGSPSIRVNGRDVEPGADARSDYAFSCRVYRTESGLKGAPEERWLRNALRADV